MLKTYMSWKSVWIYLKSQIKFWNLKIWSRSENLLFFVIQRWTPQSEKLQNSIWDFRYFQMNFQETHRSFGHLYCSAGCADHCNFCGKDSVCTVFIVYIFRDLAFNRRVVCSLLRHDINWRAYWWARVSIGRGPRFIRAGTFNNITLHHVTNQIQLQ